MLMIRRVLVAKQLPYIFNSSKPIHVLCGLVYSSQVESLINPGVRKYVDKLIQRHSNIVNKLSSENVILYICYDNETLIYYLLLINCQFSVD